MERTRTAGSCCHSCRQVQRADIRAGVSVDNDNIAKLP